MMFGLKTRVYGPYWPPLLTVGLLALVFQATTTDLAASDPGVAIESAWTTPVVGSVNVGTPLSTPTAGLYAGSMPEVHRYRTFWLTKPEEYGRTLVLPRFTSTG